MMPTTQHLLFLSHAGADSEAAKRLKLAIEQSPAARDAGLRVWLDKTDLPPGKRWQNQLAEVLTKHATAFAVMVGSKGVVNWVANEVDLAISRATKERDKNTRGFPFIPVLLENSAGSSALPPFAQQYHGVRDPFSAPGELGKLIAAAIGDESGENKKLIEEPFVGLRPMREADANLYFGRKVEIAEVLKALQQRRMVAIVADSGAGKSSLAMAGVAPAFRGNRLRDTSGEAPEDLIHHVVVMRPGNDPLQGLKDGISDAAEALGRSPDERAGLRRRVDPSDPSETVYALRCDLDRGLTRTLLIIDQFEEMFTQTPDALRQGFADFALALLAADPHLKILITMREDYFNLCSELPDLFAKLDRAATPATYRLKRITKEGLKEAVVRPLEMTGKVKEPEAEALAKAIIDNLPESPGALALAQAAMELSWKRRLADEGLLGAYMAIGRVAGALASKGGDVLSHLPSALPHIVDPEKRLLAVFVRLAELGIAGSATRRIALLEEFDAPARKLIDHLSTQAGGRLLLVGGQTVEIAHEALITQWPWLHGEIRKAAPDMRILTPLMEKATRWKSDRMDRLATGAELRDFGALAERQSQWLSSTEHAFVDAGQRRERNVRWRSRATMFVLALLAAVSLNLAVNARKQAKRADNAATQAQAATQRASKNLSAALTALADVEATKSPVKAAKLSLAAWPKSASSDLPGMEVTATAFGAVILNFRQRVTTGHDEGVFNAAFSPDGARIVTASADNTARIWDAGTGKVIIRLTGHDDSVNSADFSPDGARIVTASDDNTARNWDAGTGKEITRLTGHDDSVNSADFSPDGARIVTASDDKTARIWDISSIPKGSIFDIACAWLPMVNGKKDTDLTGLADEYQLTLDEKICEEGKRPPIPILPWVNGVAKLQNPPPLPEKKR